MPAKSHLMGNATEDKQKYIFLEICDAHRADSINRISTTDLKGTTKTRHPFFNEITLVPVLEQNTIPDIRTTRLLTQGRAIIAYKKPQRK